MGYEAIRLEKPLLVEELVTVHYFEYSSSYYFDGEQHDFWELVYVDKGEVDVEAGSCRLKLTRGQVIFHRPGEFHALRANGKVAPNLVVITFRCRGDMSFFDDKVLSTDGGERALLGRMIEEGSAAFTTPLDDPMTTSLARNPEAPFGSEQLLAGALEELLIHLVRRGSAPLPPALPPRTGEELFDRVVPYLEANLGRSLTLEEICRENLAGRSRLQTTFKAKTGGGVMAYFGKLKIGAARRMIREGGRNFTEISALLGYQSIYYFSRHFKKATGMTPSEYAASVKVLSAKHKNPVSRG